MSPIKSWQLWVLKIYKVFMERTYTIVTPYVVCPHMKPHHLARKERVAKLLTCGAAGEQSLKPAHLISCLPLKYCGVCFAFARCSPVGTDRYARRRRYVEMASPLPLAVAATRNGIRASCLEAFKRALRDMHASLYIPHAND